MDIRINIKVRMETKIKYNIHEVTIKSEIIIMQNWHQNQYKIKVKVKNKTMIEIKVNRK